MTYFVLKANLAHPIQNFDEKKFLQKEQSIEEVNQ